ncbi:MAG: helix-turn-helix domain-containing protein [Pseudomonadota bacterium]
MKHKLELLDPAKELGNVSQTCRAMGVSRDTFYRYQEAQEQGGIDALLHKDRRRPNREHRVDDAIEHTVRDHAVGQPAYAQVRVSNELHQRGVLVSLSAVCRIWLRAALANFTQRLSALEKHVAGIGVVLTEAHVVVRERTSDDDAACGEVETAPPDCPGSQVAFHVGTTQRVGRIHQQTYVASHCRMASSRCTSPRHRSPRRIY